MDAHTIAGGTLEATVKADGAELCSLRAGGREILWSGAAPWPRHAPVLFPIVGRLKNDRLQHAGRDYRLTQHGFARDRRFEWEQTSEAACRLVLVDDERTRAMYPFPFRFEVSYAIRDAIHGAALVATFAVTNTGTDILPASMGAHPAFRWPLADGVAKPAHRLVFEHEEDSPIWRVSGGLLTANTFLSPIEDAVLPLDVGLFADDAIILLQPASRSVRYSGPGTPTVQVSWDGFTELGIWSRADADLLCIEPWRGYSSPATFDGEFRDKPGLMLISPGERREATHQILIEI